MYVYIWLLFLLFHFRVWYTCMCICLFVCMGHMLLVWVCACPCMHTCTHKCTCTGKPVMIKSSRLFFTLLFRWSYFDHQGWKPWKLCHSWGGHRGMASSFSPWGSYWHSSPVPYQPRPCLNCSIHFPVAMVLESTCDPASVAVELLNSSAFCVA